MPSLRLGNVAPCLGRGRGICSISNILVIKFLLARAGWRHAFGGVKEHKAIYQFKFAKFYRYWLKLLEPGNFHGASCFVVVWIGKNLGLNLQKDLYVSCFRIRRRIHVILAETLYQAEGIFAYCRQKFCRLKRRSRRSRPKEKTHPGRKGKISPGRRQVFHLGGSKGDGPQ